MVTQGVSHTALCLLPTCIDSLCMKTHEGCCSLGLAGRQLSCVGFPAPCLGVLDPTTPPPAAPLNDRRLGKEEKVKKRLLAAALTKKQLVLQRRPLSGRGEKGGLCKWLHMPCNSFRLHGGDLPQLRCCPVDRAESMQLKIRTHHVFQTAAMRTFRAASLEENAEAVSAAYILHKPCH